MEPSPSLLNCSKDYWKLLPFLISINWPSLVTLWVLVQKIYSKMYLVLCTNTHRDITDLVNHGKVENAKTWISWKRDMVFLRNKKILNLCLRWHILRNYHFVAEATFNLVCIQLFGIFELTEVSGEGLLNFKEVFYDKLVIILTPLDVKSDHLSHLGHFLEK